MSLVGRLVTRTGQTNQSIERQKDESAGKQGEPMFSTCFDTSGGPTRLKLNQGTHQELMSHIALIGRTYIRSFRVKSSNVKFGGLFSNS